MESLRDEYKKTRKDFGKKCLFTGKNTDEECSNVEQIEKNVYCKDHEGLKKRATI